MFRNYLLFLFGLFNYALYSQITEFEINKSYAGIKFQQFVSEVEQRYPIYEFDEIIIQPKNPGNNQYLITIDNYNQSFPYSTNEFFSPQKNQEDFINEIIRNALISKNYYEKTNSEDIESKMNSFYGNPDLERNFDEYLHLPNMEEYFSEIIPTGWIKKRKDQSTIRVVELNKNSPTKKQAFCMIDGVPVYDHNVIVNMNPELIERIEVIQNIWVYGELTFNGIFHVITRKGNFSDVQLPSYAIRKRFKLFQLPHKFPNLEYNKENYTNRIPDYRNTLYWNPNLNTNENGKTSIEFFTDDEPTQYEVVVEGISEDGKCGYKTVLIEVTED